MTGLLKLQLSPKTLAVTLVATLIVLTGACWFTLIAPKQSQANDLTTQIGAAQTQVFLRQSAAGKKVDTAAQSTFVQRALPDTLAMPQIVLELNRIAVEEHVTLLSITPSGATPFSSFIQTPITISVTGKFFDVEGFLRELRSQVVVTNGAVSSTGRLFDVQGINITQGSKPPLIVASLNVDAFNYTVPVAPPTPTTTTPAS